MTPPDDTLKRLKEIEAITNQVSRFGTVFVHSDDCTKCEALTKIAQLKGGA